MSLLQKGTGSPPRRDRGSPALSDQCTLSGNRFVRIRNRPYNDDPRAIEFSLREELGVTDDRFRDDFEGVESKLLAGSAGGDLLRETQRSKLELSSLKARIRRACDGGGDFGGHFNNYLGARV